MRILGLDPGLLNTGWGVISTDGSQLHHVAHGVISPRPSLAMAERLTVIHRGVSDVLADQVPDQVAIEETFVSLNADSTLKLGLARGAALVAAAATGIEVSEYATRLVKKTLVGTGKAEKHQVAAMIGILLPGAKAARSDAADALAVAVCHAYHSRTLERIIAGTRA